MTQSMSLDDATRLDWDAIVIGTGMGGATLGHKLASEGERVVFCEIGRDPTRDASALTGRYAELEARPCGAVLGPADEALLRRAGRWTEAVIDASTAAPVSFVPFIGSGVGGSSALFGMALERFTARDFEPRASHPRAPRASLVEAWPLDYSAFVAHYAAAEALYRVRGDPDPLAPRAEPLPPRPRSPGLAAADLIDFFSLKGLHPYRLPLACEFTEGCACCQGFLCQNRCKNDSAQVCLRPAIAEHGALLLDECRAVLLLADRRRITGVACRRHGQERVLRGKRVFLAAGALQTPNLLLRSRSADWPQGLANGSGLVGRNLMRHAIDLYLVESARVDTSFDNRVKEFGFSDFYQSDHFKLGSVQSFGRLPPAEMLAGSFERELRDGGHRWAAAVARQSRPLLLKMLGRWVDRSICLAAIMEDLPYPENRVAPAEDVNEGGIRMTYRLDSGDHERIAQFRLLMREALRGRRWRRIDQANNNQRLAHACGTCRFGDDPATSVLDRFNRCHQLDNLYVVDSSFFPSSGGTNPSLTIAANALRVAQAVAL